MAGRYETWITGHRAAWMGPNARALWGGVGKLLGDDAVEWARQALLEHLPEWAGDVASLALLAVERMIEPGPTETTADLRVRLRRSREQARFSGRALGMLVALHFAEFEDAVIVTQNGLAHSLSGDPDLDDLTLEHVVTLLGPGPPRAPINGHPWWTFDTDDAWCSRFAILFPDPTTVDLTIAANLARIKRVVKQWKPAKAACVGAYVVTSGKLVGWPPRLVNDGGNVGPSTVLHYPMEP